MVTLITQGIEVTVETLYQADYSRPLSNEFVFAYHINIHNHNPFTAQLLRRRWMITDAERNVKVVEGDGVVGRQPVLYPGDAHQYVSACNLATPIGKMRGIYVFENKATRKEFEVEVPEFKMETPQILN